MRIRILGGTHFGGSHQIRYALSRGHKVAVFNRISQTDALPADVEHLTGDQESGELQALDGRDWAVRLDNPTALPALVRDMGSLLRGRVGQYLFMSTISVYAAHERPADESTHLAACEGRDPVAASVDWVRASNCTLYGSLKAVSEREAHEWFEEAATIICPGLIVGSRDDTDRFTYWPARLGADGEVLVRADGTDAVQIIDVRDLAEWTVRLAESGTVVNAIGPAHPLNMRERLEGSAALIPAKLRMTWVLAHFHEAEAIAPWCDKPTCRPQRGAYGWSARRSGARALAAGLSVRPLADTVAAPLVSRSDKTTEDQGALKVGLSAEHEQDGLAHWHASQVA